MRAGDPLLAAWEETLTRKKNAPAIFATTCQVLRTFRGIEERASDFESKIDIFEPGSVIAIQIGNHEDWPSILIACLRKNIVVLPLEQSIKEQQRDAALEICCASGIVSGSASIMPAVRRILRRSSSRSAGCPTRRAGSVRSPSNVEPPDWGDKPPSLLKLTSGTTAAPRAIRFRSEQLLADCAQICETMGVRNVDLNFGIIPVSHSYGFSNLLTPLIARGVPMVLSRDRLPRAMLADLARTNATVFPGMPVLYQALCDIENVPLLPQLRLCISAGAPLSVAVARKFQEKFKRPIHSFYGASECGGICYDEEAANEIEGFVGKPTKDVTLEIVDPDAPASQVRVRSAAVGDGYFPEPDTKKFGDGYFVPDDLLASHESGFKIVGRISDVINVAGEKVNPAEVEAHLLRFAGIRQAVVFGRESGLRNEEVMACVVADVDVGEMNLLDFCRTGLSSWQVPKRIFIVDAIPVSERGKINRRSLAHYFASS